MSMSDDVLVIGAGYAGLVAAWRATTHGKRTKVITKGWGATHWHSGCIDVLGYYPVDAAVALESPAEGLAALLDDNPDHPYGVGGIEAIGDALGAFRDVCDEAGYPLHGSLQQNWLLPSAVGAFRPTCLAPETMIAGDLRRRDPMLIVGFQHLNDFYPNLIADNLTNQDVLARGVMLDLPTLRQRRFTTTVLLSKMFDTPPFRTEVVRALKPKVGRTARVGFPAVLGFQRPMEVKRDLEQQLGCKVFEIPTLPSSVPGIRLHNVLKDAIQAAGGRVFDGMEALSANTEADRVTTVWTEAAVREQPHRADTFVLATGGILGGGIFANHDGSVREVIFDLPVNAPPERDDWFRRDFLDPNGHPVQRAGLVVNESFQPIDTEGNVVYENLYAAGTTLAHAETLRERSFEGVALTTGYCVGERIA